MAHGRARLLAEEFGVEAEPWSLEQVRDVLRTDHYFGAVHYPNAFQINPLAYALALADAAERAGVFVYSLEPDTPAVKLEGHLPEEVKQDRRNRLMEMQQTVAFDWSQRQIGRELDVILDEPDPEAPNLFRGRSYADAPDIDGVVRVKGKNLHAGDLVRVKVTAADGYDLAARALSKC